MNVAEQWKRFSREAVESPFFEITQNPAGHRPDNLQPVLGDTVLSNSLE